MSDRPIRPKEIRFANPQLERLGIEVIRLDDLRRRVSARHLATPERAEFFMVLLVTDGDLQHTIDFHTLHGGVGSLVFVHPGQVQHWHIDRPVQGRFVMIDPPALLPAVVLAAARPESATRVGVSDLLRQFGPRRPGPGGAGRCPPAVVVDSRGSRDALMVAMDDWPVHTQLDADTSNDLHAELVRLERDIAVYDTTEEDTTLIRHALLNLMLRLARWHRTRSPGAPGHGSGTGQVYRLFKRELELTFGTHPTVAQLSRRLGFSESTLNRACRTAAGHSAKVLIDRRMALEAARMMVHSRASVAQVGHDLGFSEPTNFVRFFVRMIGTTPARFRERHLPSDSR
ncbi:MAG: helix-turn-helix domain-containing protein [Burkholderiaceae bacterium]